jgi:DNA-binding NarL/FixJ family response regulator
MNPIAVRPLSSALRVLVVASEDSRSAALAILVRDLGHVAVASPSEASVVLSEGAISRIRMPTVVLGTQREGAEANLPADASPEQIDAALRAVAAGLKVTMPDSVRPAFDALDEGDSRFLLTPRETEVLFAVSKGATNKEIARALGLSLHTVKFHLESVMRKIGASTRTEAVSKAMRLGLLEPYPL